MKDFGLTDLFQLLGQQQKTGILHLQDGRNAIQVFFDKGAIVGVAFPNETTEDTTFGRSLIHGGLIDAEQWKKAYKIHKEKLLSIEKVLIQNRMVRQEDLTNLLRLLTFETIYGLFKWKGGNFRFEAKPVFYDSSFVEPQSAEYLLLDVLRMVDEWPLLAERIPNFDIVMQKVDPLATIDVLANTPWEKNRTFQMEVVFELVDGQRTVQEIIDLSFVGEFDTCKNLITLMDAGVIESGSMIPEAPKAKRTGSPSSLRSSWAGYLLVGIPVLFLIFQLAVFRGENFPFTAGEREFGRLLKKQITKIQQTKENNAREIFFAEENRYPATPAEMAKRGL